ncbi:isochorismatase family protein [Amycolatopsis halotolerans]|uniref:Isochorismatase family protein n=1 Tax=Amycolatopsis halotolerans TaxID=330083 RepID=A0ABV7QQR2_9PSEU
MAITTLDRTTALIVIDLQKGIVALPTVHPAAEIVERGNQLLAAFHRHDLPVVLVNVDGGAPGRTDAPAGGGELPADFAEFVPELDRQTSDYVVTKPNWGAFYGTSLDLRLRRLGVTQVVLAGIATSIGVESTARAAHERGYHVTLAVDAMTDLNAETHRNSLERIFPMLGESGTAQEIIDHLKNSH